MIRQAKPAESYFGFETHKLFDLRSLNNIFKNFWTQCVQKFLEMLPQGESANQPQVIRNDRHFVS